MNGRVTRTALFKSGVASESPAGVCNTAERTRLARPFAVRDEGAPDHPACSLFGLVPHWITATSTPEDDAELFCSDAVNTLAGITIDGGNCEGTGAGEPDTHGAAGEPRLSEAAEEPPALAATRETVIESDCRQKFEPENASAGPFDMLIEVPALEFEDAVLALSAAVVRAEVESRMDEETLYGTPPPVDALPVAVDCTLTRVPRTVFPMITGNVVGADTSTSVDVARGAAYRSADAVASMASNPVEDVSSRGSEVSAARAPATSPSVASSTRIDEFAKDAILATA